MLNNTALSVIFIKKVYITKNLTRIQNILWSLFLTWDKSKKNMMGVNQLSWIPPPTNDHRKKNKSSK